MVTCLYVEGAAAARSYAFGRVGALAGGLSESARVAVTLSREGCRHVAEATVVDGAISFHAVERGGDADAAVDAVAERLERQVRRPADRVR
jgi:ribosome-associated translation inhibitor RaiA